MEAWLMPEGAVADQRAENRCSPNAAVTVEDLREFGVLHWAFDPKTMLVAPEGGGKCRIDELCEELKYKNRDECVISPAMADYDKKLGIFYAEHLHEDDEIRLIADGTGYFDVRNLEDAWVRIALVAGDLIVLPAGMYHRFTPDAKDFIHAVRIFKEAPKWEALNRPSDENKFRVDYVDQFVANPPKKQTAAGEADGAANIYVHHPGTIDKVLRPLIGRTPDASADLIVVYITGTHNATTGQSWCPDCVTADPFVAAGVAQLREQRKVTFVHAAVERSSFLGKPDFLYRTHPFLQVTSVPTLLVLGAKSVAGAKEGEDTEAGIDIVARLDGEVLSTEWAAKLQLKTVEVN
jgi:1,2-dihydroxy-3-keto-5-methylthiopentene dioxygenase